MVSAAVPNNKSRTELTLGSIVVSYYDMKQIITKEEVNKAIADLATQGKKPTLSQRGLLLAFGAPVPRFDGSKST